MPLNGRVEVGCSSCTKLAGSSAGRKALSAVIPKASVGYSMAGVVIMLVPALAVVVLVMAATLALNTAFLG